VQKINNHKTKQYHRSSSSFQDAGRGPDDWEIGYKAMEQQSDDSPYIQMLDQLEDQEDESDDQESESGQHRDERSRQNSMDEDEF
jgi:hypothetical protein